MRMRRTQTAIGGVVFVALALALSGDRIGTVSAAPLESPTELSGLLLWLDASDTGAVQRVTVDTDPAELDWRDKSRYGFRARGPGVQRAVGAINGKTAIRFDGANDFLAFQTPDLMKANDAKSIFSVFRGTAWRDYDFAMSTRVNHGGVDNIGNGYLIRVIRDTAYFHTGKGGAVSSNAITRGEAVLAGWTVGANAAAPSNYVNGVSLSLNPNDLQSAIAEIANGYTVIGRQSAVYAGGDVGEIVMTSGVLTKQERQRLEGYLARKWGLEDSLPDDHPYKRYQSGTMILLK